MKAILMSRGELPPRLAPPCWQPEELWISSPNDFSARAVAVVGTREPHPAAERLAGEIAAGLAQAGIVVVSGGAYGIDATAHSHALLHKGKTWCVAPTGHQHCYPPTHATLFERIAASGAMVWPFPAAQTQNPGSFKLRNGILVALSDAVVVVQAPQRSGALNAAKHARNLRRPLYVCVPPQWMKGFEGNKAELARGVARPLHSVDQLLADVARPSRSNEAQQVLEALSNTPLHADEIAARSGLPAHLAATALLTLALEDVVVEGPSGFFRRANPA